MVPEGFASNASALQTPSLVPILGKDILPLPSLQFIVLFLSSSFNRIDLPSYNSYHKLKENLKLAVENTEGFEGVD